MCVLWQVLIGAMRTASAEHPLRALTMWLAGENGFKPAAGSDDSAQDASELSEWRELEARLRKQNANKPQADLAQTIAQARQDFDRMLMRRREKVRSDQEATHDVCGHMMYAVT